MTMGHEGVKGRADAKTEILFFSDKFLIEAQLSKEE